LYSLFSIRQTKKCGISVCKNNFILKLFVLAVQFYQKGKIDLNFNCFVIVHTKQFLSFLSSVREIICLFALLQFRVNEFEKKSFYNLIGLVGLL
jgi:hypothetical protein